MREIISFIIVLCMVLSFCGCSANNNDAPDLETKYYEYAQECIEKGDTETAIKALEEGVEKTGSEKLKELLNTLKDDNKEEYNKQKQRVREELQNQLENCNEAIDESQLTDSNPLSLNIKSWYMSQYPSDEVGKTLVTKYGKDILNEIAKLNFKNTEKINELLNK